MSVPSVVLAEASWYGSLRGGVEVGGGNDASFKDGGSRWGIKGSSEISEGLSAVYRFEHKISTTDASQPGGRLAYAGLSGGFGTVSLGQVWSASFNHVGGITDGSWFYGDSETSYRVGNALSYAISAGAISMQLDAIMDGGKDTGDSVDQLEFGMTVNLGDIGKLGLAYVDTKDETVSMTSFVKGQPTIVKVIQEGRATTLPTFTTGEDTEHIIKGQVVSKADGVTEVTIPKVTVTQKGSPVTQLEEDLSLTSIDFSFTANGGRFEPTGAWRGQTKAGETRTFDFDNISSPTHRVRLDGTSGLTSTDSAEGTIQDVAATKVIFVTTGSALSPDPELDLTSYTSTRSNGITTYTHEDAVGCADEDACQYSAGFLAQYIAYNDDGTPQSDPIVEGDNVVNRVRRQNSFLGVDASIRHEAVAEDVVTGLSIEGHQVTEVTVEADGLTINVPVQNVTIEDGDQTTITIPGTLAVTKDGEEGQPTVVEITQEGMASHYKTEEKVIKGSRATHVAAQFNLGALTAYVGHSQKKVNGSDMKNKTTHYGISGGLGDTGMSFHAMARNKDNASGMDSTPWLVGLTKGLGGGATVMVEHGNADDGKSGKTRFGLKVDF